MIGVDAAVDDARVTGLVVVVVVFGAAITAFSPFFCCDVVLSPVLPALLRAADGDPIAIISASVGFVVRGDVIVGDVTVPVACDRVVVRVEPAATRGDVIGAGDVRRGDMMVVDAVWVARGDVSVVAVVVVDRV